MPVASNGERTADVPKRRAAIYRHEAIARAFAPDGSGGIHFHDAVADYVEDAITSTPDIHFSLAQPVPACAHSDLPQRAGNVAYPGRKIIRDGSGNRDGADAADIEGATTGAADNQFCSGFERRISVGECNDTDARRLVANLELAGGDGQSAIADMQCAVPAIANAERAGDTPT
jgi:hypothetical protein